ncbi:MAG: FtsW/RodA/SpoVE family cell cycle protein [Oscillospiraceae bacterium]|nr:FtsW/RodA/SpoVE family cell cycle protein [Oscillospiraceae bacterium]
MQGNRGKSEFSAPREAPPVSPARQANLEKMAELRTVAEHRARATTTAVPRRATPDYSRFNAGAGGGVAVSRNPAAVNPQAQAQTGTVNPAKKANTRRVYERLPKFDMPFFTIVIVLLAFGVVMMFSASYAYAQRVHSDSYYYVMRQVMYIGGGLLALIILSYFPYRIFLNKGLLTLGSMITLSLMLFTAIAGRTFSGATRWIDFGLFTIQPSEILKFVIIVIFAYLGHTRFNRIKEFKYGFLPFVFFMGVACGLMIIQPHLSGTIIVFSIGIIMMLVAECKLKHILLLLLIFAVFAGLALMAMNALGINYFEARFESWKDPESDIQGATFQTYQSLITIGSGGIFGLGLGNSRQKYAYLPESHNDFIFSIVCEELGFVGAALVVLLFILFIARGFYIASKARDRFGMLLAAGMTSHMGIQALLNIGVATNTVPNTGISLPFFSYGGTALMMQLAEIGIILNISRKSAIK